MVLTAALNLVFAAVGSFIIWKFYGSKLVNRGVMHSAGAAVVNAIKEPNEETTEAMHAMMSMGWNWFLSAKIPTGKKIKVTSDDGEVVETEEELTPYVMIMRETGRQLMFQFKGLKGGLMSQAGRDIAEGLAAEGVPLLGSMGPRKGQTTAEWAFEQLLARAMPQIEQKVNTMLKKGETSTSSGGWV